MVEIPEGDTVTGRRLARSVPSQFDPENMDSMNSFSFLHNISIDELFLNPKKLRVALGSPHSLNNFSSLSVNDSHSLSVQSIYDNYLNNRTNKLESGLRLQQEEKLHNYVLDNIEPASANVSPQMQALIRHFISNYMYIGELYPISTLSLFFR